MAEKRKQNNLREFVAEAEEHIESIHKNLAKIEKLSDRTKVRPDTVNAIFRAAHTLKGMSGMVGLLKISELSHTMEDLLDKIRMGKMRFEPAVLEILLETVDFLQEMVNNANQGKPEKDPGHLNKTIRALLSGKVIAPKSDLSANKTVSHAFGASSEAVSAAVGREGKTAAQMDHQTEKEGNNPGPDTLLSLDLDPSFTRVLTEYEGHRLQENLSSGARIYLVSARFRMESFDKDLSELSACLNEIGEVISTLPSTEGAGTEQIMFNLLIGVSPEGPALSSVLSRPELEIREVGRKNEPKESAPTAITEAVQDLHGPDSALTTERGGDGADADVQDELMSIKSQSQTIRVEIDRLDTLLNLVGELVLTKAVIHEIGRELLSQQGFSGIAMELSKASRMLDKRVTEVQEEIVRVRMIPIGQIFDRLIRAVRKLSKELGKPIDLQLSGEETKMDKSMVEEISDPLMHLVRNALDHGIDSREERKSAGKPEMGTIWLRAAQKGSSVVIEVEDDGKGIDTRKIYEKAVQNGLVPEGKEMTDREIINLLFLPGFSTRESVTEVSGRGVGLDVVAKNVTRLSGLVDVESKPGKGSKFSITLPITLVIIKALIVRAGTETFAIPLNSVSESLMVLPGDIRTVERHEVVQLRDHTLSLLHLREVFRLNKNEDRRDRVYVIVVGMAEKRLGLVVDTIEGQQEIVIKSLGSVLRGIPGIAGATELGNRKTVLVLDVAALIEESARKLT